VGTFRAENVLLDTSRVTITATGSSGTIEGLPPGLKLLDEPRPPLAYPLEESMAGTDIRRLHQPEA
jgi:hypothetical protein